ncbi:hypothetical protein EBT31_03180 [bacterium]|nr:hypothetical protein [bacterium]
MLVFPITLPWSAIKAMAKKQGKKANVASRKVAKRLLKTLLQRAGREVKKLLERSSRPAPPAPPPPPP